MVDLKQMMVIWAKQTKQKVSQGVALDTPYPNFNLVNYHWILNTGNRAQMLVWYNKVDWNANIEG